MKILVTGGAGFIGSHIVDEYIKKGYKVSVIDNLFTGKKENINPKAKFYFCDITKDCVSKIFKSHRFDVVNHQAAQVDVRKSVKDPIFDTKVNIIGSLNILQNCIKYKTKKLIFASSGGVIYGECKKRPSERFPYLFPLSPYGISKLSIERYIFYYHRIFRLPFTIFRYGNVFGPRQDPFGEAGVVAIFSGKMIDNKDVFIFGDGKQIRDYIYVDDVVEANLLAIKKGNNHIFNIGSGKSISVNTLFYLMKKIANYKKDPIYKPKRAGELQRSLLDIKKAKAVLNWHPQVSLVSGLNRTINWFNNKIR